MKTSWPEEMLEEITKVKILSEIERIFQFLRPRHVVLLIVMIDSTTLFIKYEDKVYPIDRNYPAYRLKTI